MKKTITAIGIIIQLISCSTEPNFSENSIELKEIDVACTEAYLKISVGETNQNQTVILKRDGQEILRYSAETKDSVIKDTLLTESTTYTYSAILKENGNEAAKYTLELTTLAPTSHQFNWEYFEFGANSTSELNDICVVSSNEIWAVGLVSSFDSSGKEVPHHYNTLFYNGKSWSKKRTKVFISYQDYRYESESIRGEIIIRDKNGTLIFVSAGGGIAFNINDNWSYMIPPKGVEQPYSCTMLLQ
ncbi:MAG: hypothetical protein JEY94_15060 [Melioribacteraceae bacterium]|nr:hypothetical protein [Melioribacteraceae bacterium]